MYLMNSTLVVVYKFGGECLGERGCERAIEGCVESLGFQDELVKLELDEQDMLVLAEHEMYMLVLVMQAMFVGDVVDDVDVLKVSELIS